MKRTTSATLAVVTISALAIGATAAGASVHAKADPQKVCDAIASGPETAKQELKAIRLAQSGDNAEVEAALAKMEQAAEKAVKSGKSGPIQTNAYNAQLSKLFAFGFEECTEAQVEATVTADGVTGVPATVDAGSVGFELQNDTDESAFLGVVKVAPDNTATADEIVAALVATEDEAPSGVEFVGGGEAGAGEAGYALVELESGRYLFIAGSDGAGSLGHSEFTVA